VVNSHAIIKLPGYTTSKAPVLSHFPTLLNTISTCVEVASHWRRMDWNGLCGSFPNA